MVENFVPQLAAQQEPLKRALVDLVRIPSVCGEGYGEYPCGNQIDQALRKALQIAGDLGFITQYGDGCYYGYEKVGEGMDMLGILGHLDIVPPGKLQNWDRDPFDPVERDHGFEICPDHSPDCNFLGYSAVCMEHIADLPTNFCDLDLDHHLSLGSRGSMEKHQQA